MNPTRPAAQVAHAAQNARTAGPARAAIFEPLEGRRLFSFALPDATFGTDGIARVGRAGGSGGPSGTTGVVALDGGGFLAVTRRPTELTIGDASYSTTYFPSNAAAEFLRQDGTVDPARRAIRLGFDPTDADSREGRLLAVDGATGRALVLRNASDDAPQALELYGPDGRPTGTIAPADRPTEGGARAAAFGPGGSVVVAFDVPPVPGSYYENVQSSAVARYGPDGRRDFAYGDGGSAVLPQAAVASAGIDAAGRAYFLTEFSSDRSLFAEYRYNLARVGPDGRVDADYDGEVARVNGGAGYDYGITPTEARVAPDGRVTLLLAKDSSSDYSRELRTVSAVRFDAAGVAGEPLVLSANDASTPEVARDVQLALAPDGSAYAAATSADYPQVWHLLGEPADSTRSAGLRFDPAWGDFGPFATLASRMELADLAVDAAGRPVLAGRSFSFADGYDLPGKDTSPTPIGTGALVAVAGSTAGFGTASGSLRLLPGGTLEVSGTGRADAVSINYKGDFVGVAINGGKRKRFAASSLRGLIVHTGGGDDRIEINARVGGAYVQAGRGNDTVYGTHAGDTLVGGAGDDRLFGGNGDDQLYGQDGDDWLEGGRGADLIYGGNGGDRVIAFRRDSGLDSYPDTLVGGRGADRLAVDRGGGLGVESSDDLIVSDESDYVEFLFL